jgi:undecaprenyl-diphosphatase
VADANSPYLAFIVGMHVATAIALLIYFWRDWIRIISGFFSSIRDRRVQTRDQRLAWMIILATIPVGLVGVVADKPFREIFGKPIVAGVFLIINGVILYCGERFRPASSIRADQDIAAQREQALMPAAAGARRPPAPPGMARQARHASGQQAVRQEELIQAIQADERLSRMGYLRALTIGASQILALLAGISRDGVSMVTGMSRGLSREDAARFAFLLATPVILAAGVLELPKLTGPEGHGIHGQILLGSILSGVGSYISVRFLMRYFQTRTLTPFAIYCFVFGLLSVLYLGFIK